MEGSWYPKKWIALGENHQAINNITLKISQEEMQVSNLKKTHGINNSKQKQSYKRNIKYCDRINIWYTNVDTLTKDN